jgi:alpha-glucoside transport system ATP-binding protein
MSSLDLKGVGKAYGELNVLKDVNLDIERGEFIVFVGPSGCGKSTLLRMIAGLEDVTHGTLTLDGMELNEVPPARRGIAMVFQSYALYPHMSVYENMAFGLKIAGVDKAEIDRKVRSAADVLQLVPLLDRQPRALSGGQRQRVAIGRAICRDPKVFLFDEPLSNLDASLRVATRLEIARLKQAMPNTTMIYVTHDQVEAMTLADRIVVLAGGRIEQVGTPMELYHEPANTFVAQFIGSPAMNLFPVEKFADTNAIALRSGRAVAISKDKVGGGGTVATIGMRPEHLTMATPEDFLFEARVSVREQLGEFTQLYLETAVSESPVIMKIPGGPAPEPGDHVHVSISSAHIHVFDEKGRAIR